MTQNPLTLTLVGGPTAVIDYAGLRLLTDPTFDAPQTYPGGIPLHKLTGPALDADAVGEIDAVLLSHDQHPDNLDEAGRAFLPRAGVVLSTPEAEDRVEGVTGLAPWQTHRIGDVEITAVPALHGPEGAEELSGTVTGFVLSAPGSGSSTSRATTPRSRSSRPSRSGSGASTSRCSSPVRRTSAASATPTSPSTRAPRSRRRASSATP